jgi:hypothetical protein
MSEKKFIFSHLFFVCILTFCFAFCILLTEIRSAEMGSWMFGSSTASSLMKKSKSQHGRMNFQQVGCTCSMSREGAIDQG